ncbi:hypothetical protein [Bradyrhizobium sp. C9]|uniref:hypothetical protein n=1 Tax=Bradyrhizobium sp. C9 TaxID=142585 RepID=UPI000BE9ECC2|nr:hypothetical protein [Bradyrhizobium sp. C9]PDT75651.1 hypothetical protein CO675_19690 [Bradyrhizobium sp. C9]
MTIMGNGRDIFSRIVHANPSARARGWWTHWLEAIDGDFAFKVLVMAGGMLSTAAFAFGLLPL